jgi:hypothetical protein
MDCPQDVDGLHAIKRTISQINRRNDLSQHGGLSGLKKGNWAITVKKFSGLVTGSRSIRKNELFLLTLL